MTAPIRVVVADDHPLIISALHNLFRAEGDIELVARCTDGQDVVPAVCRHKPDILLLDIRMPGKGGLAVLRQLRLDNHPVRVVILTAALDDHELLEAARLGVNGVVLKEMAPALLVQCIRKVHAGEEWVERRSMSRAVEKLLRREAAASQGAGVLTPRELEIVQLVAGGARNRAIADRLHITEGTVKIHLHHIYEKLAVGSRLELTLHARDHGLV